MMLYMHFWLLELCSSLLHTLNQKVKKRLISCLRVSFVFPNPQTKTKLMFCRCALCRIHPTSSPIKNYMVYPQ
ncbi:hypothetical protein PCASD_06439 [Puccinia coronata f. sp. avenae]|uniref:Secreted protein n=1 Tax=Puccinia coronata f. sp. avenae TaxID=200324 RepID=A0A2N5UFI9_9BASI|nr:hypothetical protein PCASD_09240 [Puccinia coronata f. sp. avenae]PLW36511.1 hypothetical protein PCASD_06439 [Puccinia coronata f. sp. avenae]